MSKKTTSERKKRITLWVTAKKYTEFARVAKAENSRVEVVAAARLEDAPAPRPEASSPQDG